MFKFCYCAKILQIMTFRGQRDTETEVIEIQQLKFKVVSGLRGHTMSSEANRPARLWGPLPSCFFAWGLARRWSKWCK